MHLSGDSVRLVDLSRWTPRHRDTEKRRNSLGGTALALRVLLVSKKRRRSSRCLGASVSTPEIYPNPSYFLMRVTFPAGSTSKTASVALSRILSAEFLDVDFLAVVLGPALGAALLAVTPGMSGSAVTAAAAAAALSVAAGSSFFSTVVHPTARRTRPAAHEIGLIARSADVPDLSE